MRNADTTGIADIADPRVRAAIRALFPTRPPPSSSSSASASSSSASSSSSPVLLAAASSAPSRPQPPNTTIVLEAEEAEAYIKQTDARSAGGESGWTFALHKTFMRHQGVTSLLPLLSGIVNNRIPTGGMAHLKRLKGIPLNKALPSPTEEPQIRPLALPETTVKLAEGILVRRLAPILRQATGAGFTEFGYGGGSEALPLLIRTLLRQNPSWVCIKGDIANGFGTLSRRALISAAETIPDLAPLAHFLYDTSAEVGFSQVARGSIPAASMQTILEVGLAQGSASSPAIYALTVAPAFKAARRAHPRVTILSILDDSYILGEPAAAFAASATLDQKRTALGQRLRPNKSSAHCPAPLDAAALTTLALNAGIPLTTGSVGPKAGLMVAGTHVGSPQFEGEGVAASLAATLRTADAIKDASTDEGFRTQTTLSVLQGCFMALRLCVASKFQYTLATYPPAATVQAASSIDTHIERVQYALLGFPGAVLDALTTDHVPNGPVNLKRRTFLPTRMGGMGITSSTVAHMGAYIGNWARNGTVIHSHVKDLLTPGVIEGPQTDPAPHATGLHAAIRALRPFTSLRYITASSILVKKSEKLQRSIAEEQHKATTSLVASSSAASTAAAFASNAGHAASAWLFAPPSGRHTSMSDAQFCLAYMYRLGHHMIPFRAVDALAAQCAAAVAQGEQLPYPTCTAEQCGKHIISNDHALRCAGVKGGYTSRHNAIRDACHAIFNGTPNTSAKKEVQMDAHFARKPTATCGNMGLRADARVVTTPAGGSRHIDFLDYVVVNINPALPAYKKLAHVASSAVEASREKFNLYNKNYEMHSADGVRAGTLVPISFETSGAMDPASYIWLLKIANLGVDNSPFSKYDYAFRVLGITQRLSVALQLGNARLIQAWHEAAFPVIAAKVQQVGARAAAGGARVGGPANR